MAWAYLFEAKGIQRYIVETGLRRDLVGASELVAQLARSSGADLLEDILIACDAKDAVDIVRRAGGVFLLCAKEKETLARIRALTRLVISLTRPGLEFTDALKEGASRREAIEKVYKAGSGVRENSAAMVAPFGGPATAFVQRTGRPALAQTKEENEDEERRGDFDDRITRPQARIAAALRESLDNDLVGKRFLYQKDWEKYIFPRNLTDEKKASRYNPLFPWLERDKRWLAAIHVDLSGVGQFFRGIQRAIFEAGTPDEEIPDALSEASKRLEDAIEKAACDTTRATLLRYAKPTPFPNGETRGVAPARPIVLGGDDITILVRADRAFAFVLDFLEAIETETQSAMAELKARFNAELPERLSACAGVAFLSATHPFDAGNAVTEELCKAAKKAAKATVKKGEVPPSALAFHVMSATVRERYDDMLAAELTARAGDIETQLTLGAYFAGPLALQKDLAPHADDLRKLVEALDEIEGLGPLRGMPAAYASDPEEASRLWRRWCEVQNRAGQNGAEAKTNAPPDAVKEALAALGCDAAGESPEITRSAGDESKDKGVRRRAETPLFDALRLIAFKADPDTDGKEEAA